MAIAKNGPLYCLPFQRVTARTPCRCGSGATRGVGPRLSRRRSELGATSSGSVEHGSYRLSRWGCWGEVERPARWSTYPAPSWNDPDCRGLTTKLSEWAGWCSAPSTQSQKEQLVSVSHNLMFYIILAIGVATSYPGVQILRSWAAVTNRRGVYREAQEAIRKAHVGRRGIVGRRYPPIPAGVWDNLGDYPRDLSTFYPSSA